MNSSLVPSFLLALSVGGVAFGAPWFTAPDGPWASKPSEKIETILWTGGAVEGLQEKIDRTRKANDESILVVRVAGRLDASRQPLRLGDRMHLVFAPEAGMAGTSSPLLLVDGAESVTVTGGTFVGEGATGAGVEVRKSARVHLDGLSLRGFSVAVSWEGRGGERWAESGSFTRGEVRDCAKGLVVREAGRFYALDGAFDVAELAVDLASPGATCAGNRVRSGRDGIRLDGEGALVTDNDVRCSGIAFDLGEGSTKSSVSANRIRSGASAFSGAGAGNFLWQNAVDPSVRFWAGSGKGNLIVGRSEPTGPVSDWTAQSAFFPASLHSNRPGAVVPGVSQKVLRFVGGKAATNRTELAPVQEGIDAARKEAPEGMLVVSLAGHFSLRSAQGLVVPSDTAVVLDGSIRAELPELPPEGPKTKNTQVVWLSGKGFAAFCGGELDANGQVAHGVNASGLNVAVVDGVTVKRSASDGFMTKGHGASKLPVFFSQCASLDAGGRGYWVHVTKYVHVRDCVATGSRQDGVDLDAHSRDSFVWGNQLGFNGRHGVFIEEAVTGHHVFGNSMIGNTGSGVHVWNEEVKGNTGSNSIACNRAVGNRRGVSCGARAADRTAMGNQFFNDVTYDNRDLDFLLAGPHGSGNDVAQPVLPASSSRYLLRTPVEFNWTSAPESAR